jgi:hypothetical protein
MHIYTKHMVVIIKYVGTEPSGIEGEEHKIARHSQTFWKVF